MNTVLLANFTKVLQKQIIHTSTSVFISKNNFPISFIYLLLDEQHCILINEQPEILDRSY